jgi:hypothetical protein
MVVGRELKNSRIQEFRSSGVQEPAAAIQRMRGIDRHGKTPNSYRPSLAELRILEF